MQNAVCVVIKHPVDRTLVLGISRKDDHNAWGVPGGKVDEGERKFDAALREIKEELGLDLDPTMLRPIYTGDDGHSMVTTFIYDGVVQEDAPAVPEHELAVHKWLDWPTLTTPGTSPFWDYNIRLRHAFIMNTGGR